MAFKVKLVSSLNKVFPTRAPGKSIRKGAVLGNEIFSFQAAYFSDEFWSDIEVNVDSLLAEYISVRQVELVPVDYLPALDDDALLTEPGVAPDLLTNLWQKRIMTVAGQWRTLWISVNVRGNAAPGKFPVKIIFTRIAPDGRKKVVASPVLELEVLDAVLPEQKLNVTHWFHSDCIAGFYNIEIFSEKYWEYCENFINNAVVHGMNTLLTPIFTPPLDTQVGGERPTVQLVKIYKNDGKYHFDFSLLERWITMGQRCGIKTFEMAHFFTQWGAKATPKIIADTPDGETRIGGWEIPADSPEFEKFLAEFLPALTGFLRTKNLQDKVFFHCSDEPRKNHLKSYAFASTLMRKYLKGFKIIDALSRFELFKHGHVDIPVVCEHHYAPYRDIELPERWIYYCCEPYTGYPNRFIHMPSARNRIFGALMYSYNIDGFLHWGFNFYYSRFSRFKIDPFACTTAHHAFPAGDAFLVYPGADGTPLDSIRHEVFREALQDMRLLQLLEKYYSRDGLLRVLNRFAAGKKLALQDYPGTEEAVLKLRRKLESMLKKIIHRKK